MKNIILAIALFATMPLFADSTTTEGQADTTSTQVLDTSLSRRYLLVQNRCAVNLMLKTKTAHDMGEEGIVIVPGGNYEPFVAPLDKIYLKAGSGTCNYTIVEGN